MAVACAISVATPAMAAPPPGEADIDLFGLSVGDELTGVPGDLVEVYAAALAVAQNEPDDFAYPVVTDGTVVLPATSPTAVALSKADRKTAAKQLREYAKTLRKGEVAAYDPSIDVTGLINLAASPGHRSAKQIDALSSAIFDARNESSLKDAGVVMTGIGASGQVVVTLRELTSGVTSSLAKKYGVDDIVIEIDPAFEASTSYSRASDVPRYGGGAAINVPVGGCSSGFSWVSGSTHMMLTAGHCIPSGGTVYAPSGAVMGTVASGSRETWDTNVGTVYMTGTSVLRGDLALIQLPAGVTAGPLMYTGGPTSSTLATVGSMWSRSPAVGDQFCTGGSTAGEICGWSVSEINIIVQYTNDAGKPTLRNGTRATKWGGGVLHGDSGGPVYTVGADGKVVAKGIISGMKDWKILGATVKAEMFFTDIREAYFGFPGVLMIG
ncbi:MAG: S1 family peptidase [Propionibacteriaceae bacterium]|jgi:hypothetical protein|nr:S1 family peptidase [Propionibacteriaceae bacterium]